MNKKTISAILGIILFFVSCSTLKIIHDYDTSIDFSPYKTFAWARAPKEIVGSPRARLLANNPMLDRRIKNAVASQLISKGFQIAKNNPDLLIVYHVGLKDRINVSNWGYRYGPYWGPGRVDIYGYREGTLVIDFVDTKNKELVWRGIAQKALSGGRSPDQRQKTLSDIIKRLLAKFPPKK
ncbi:MAG: DUF4136 domain-containing protein [Candidatus Aminicenantes bacterium]|nr:MAG: DUF4136 domain-containing protein [Candidatus Aminicenantes bacterium]